MPPKVGNLRIAQFNASSLLAHKPEIDSYFDNEFFHIISICETWLHSGIQDALIKKPDYYIIRNDREGMRGGGVACYIHQSLKAKLLDASSGVFTNSPEFLILEITASNGEKLLFTSMYRRPEGQLFANFITSYNKFAHAYKNIIITGDLNCNIFGNNTYSTYLKDMIYSLSLFLVPSDATHHTTNSHTLLDVFILDSADKLVNFCKSSTPFINGHDILDLTFALESPIIEDKIITRRCIKRFNDEDYKLMLRDELFSSNELRMSLPPSPNQLDNIVEKFAETLGSVFDRHAPVRTFRVTKPPNPWLTDILKSRIKEKNRLYKKARRNNSLLGLAIFRDVRNKLTIDLRQAKEEYYAMKLSSINDTSRMWRELANLGITKSSLTSPLQFFTSDELNSYYASIVGADPPLSRDIFIKEVLQLPLPQPVFNFSLIDDVIIERQLDLLTSTSLSAGVDKISAFCINKSRECIVTHLKDIINLSIEQAHYPRTWGKAFIRPLCKNKTPQSPSDTRPVANLPEPSKIEERIIYQQILDFVTSNNFLDPRQSGFRANYSTQTALLRVTDDIRQGLELQKLTILVLFDFSKAFDMVPHLRLLIKLRTLGFSDSALTLMFSYLSGRSQAVIDENGNCSEWLPTTRGVPQGSVLGPLLFSLYIRDLGDNLRYTNRMIFADDTQIYLHCYPSELNHALARIMHDVQVVADFAKLNGLTLNISKSKALVLGSKAFLREINLATLPPITIGNSILPYVNSVRNLGVQLSADLSWKKHVAMISQKVHSTLHKLKYHKNSLSIDLRSKLISTLVFPHFDYCCLVYNDTTDELNTKLQVLANNCIRFVFDLRRDEHVTPYRLRLGWLTVKQRRLYFLGIMTYKIIHSQAPPYISELLPRVEETLRRSVRARVTNSTFIIPNHRTTTYHRSFRLSAAYFWHSLPANIINATSLPLFKAMLYSHLLSSPIVTQQ